ncbi:MAG: adenylyltransferase/cytidyltransferase family protein [Verrucomicrobiae bacterium]|nr:adenylyltransferase/cytidyltransferase family protein [Verrucomicrobiae bacterium]
MGFRDKRLTWEALPAWRALQARHGRRVVVTNGCFDLLHVGHASYLEQARALGDILLVGVNSDASVRAIKGHGRPVHPEDDRLGLVAALESVGAVCLFHEPGAARFLEVVRPQVWAKGGDYTLETVAQDERRIVEDGGGIVAILPLVAGHSTTRLLQRLGGESLPSAARA